MTILIRRLSGDSVAGALQTGATGVELESREKSRQSGLIRRRSRKLVTDTDSSILILTCLISAVLKRMLCILRANAGEGDGEGEAPAEPCV